MASPVFDSALGMIGWKRYFDAIIYAFLSAAHGIL
jgi:hypothetical protein